MKRYDATRTHRKVEAIHKETTKLYEKRFKKKKKNLTEEVKVKDLFSNSTTEMFKSSGQQKCHRLFKIPNIGGNISVFREPTPSPLCIIQFTQAGLSIQSI